ncbi:PAS domain S-box protein [Thermoproteota archaeon]
MKKKLSKKEQQPSQLKELRIFKRHYLIFSSNSTVLWILFIGVFLSIIGFSLLQTWQVNVDNQLFSYMSNRSQKVFLNKIEQIFDGMNLIKTYFHSKEDNIKQEFKDVKTILLHLKGIDSVYWLEKENDFYSLEDIITESKRGLPLACPMLDQEELNQRLKLSANTNHPLSLAHIDTSNKIDAVSIFIPVYDGYVDEKQGYSSANLEGFVAGDININAICLEIVQELGLSHFSVYLIESDQTNWRYTALEKSGFKSINVELPYFRSSSIIKIADKEYEIINEAEKNLLMGAQPWLPWIILVSGFSLTALLALLFYFLGGQTTRIRGIIKDRTDELEKINEMLLQKTEEQKALLSCIPSRVYFQDTQFRYVFVNKAFADFIGVPIDRIPGKKDIDFFLESELAFSRKCDKEVIRTGKEMLNIEEPMKLKDNTIVWSSISRSPYYDSEGRIVGMVGIAADITRHKEAELALRESENRFRRLSEAALEVIIIIDPIKNNKVIDVNARFRELFGYTLKEASKLSVEHFVNVSNRDILLKNLEHDKGESAFEIMLIKKDGEIFPAECRTGTLPWKGQTVKVITFRDITQRNQAVKALQESQERLSSFMDSATDSFLLLDNNLKIIEINQTLLKEFGLEKRAVLGKYILEISPQFFDESYKDKFEDVLKTGITFFDDLVPHPHFGEKDIALKAFRVGDGLGIISTDITKQKQLERELKAYTERLRKEVQLRTDELIQSEKMASIGLLVAGVAHEINNPLSYIKSSSIFIKEDLLELEKEIHDILKNPKIIQDIKEQLQANIDGVNRLVEITQILKRFAKPDTKHKIMADINQGIKDTLLILRNELKNRIKVVQDLGDLPRYYCHIGQLNQVFMNLIINAAQSMEKGRIWIKSWKTDTLIQISIQDEGYGIPPDEIERIFDPFYTTKTDGTGLGLSICFRIVKAHKGKILVESESGKGTLVTIQLPV